MEIIKKEYWDDNDGGYIGVRYFVDDSEISEEEYYDLTEEEDEIDELVHDTVLDILDTDGCPDAIEEILYDFYDIILDIVCEEVDEDMDFEDELAEYNYDEQDEVYECQCVDCLVDRYTDEIQEATGGCPCCIRESLMSFAEELLD